jgi:autotransporter-associated beta strand protein
MLSGGSLTALSEIIGQNGTACIFSQSGGFNSVSGTLYLGDNSGATGSYNFFGGSLAAGSERVGYSGSGSFTQTGGTVTLASLVLAQSAASAGTYNLNGGLLFLSGTGLTGGVGSAAFNFSSGTLQAGSSWSTSVPITLATAGSNGTVNTNGYALTFNGPLSGPGGLIVAGSGMLSLTAANAYSGNTTVDGGTLQLPSGSLVSPTQYIGYSATGGFTQSGGTNTAAGAIRIGYNPTGIGTYNLSSTGNVAAQIELLGVSGTGTFNQSAGVNSVSGTLSLGDGPNSVGNYSLSGGSLLASGWEYVGGDPSTGASSVTGSFSQTGGVNSISGTSNRLSVGYSAKSVGNYLLGGSGQLSVYEEDIGYSGNGIFTQSGGTNLLGSNISLGDNPGGSGTYNLSGGSLYSPLEFVAASGTASFFQTGGSNTVTALEVGKGSLGVYSLSGAGVLSATNEYIGFQNASSRGTLTQSGGINSVETLFLGDFAGSSGTYMLSGGSLTSHSEIIGYGNNGTACIFSQSGGFNSLSGTLYLGDSSAASGTYNLFGGSLAANTLVLGNSGGGTFAQSGGIVSTTNLYLGDLSGSSGSYSMSSGSLVALNAEYVGYAGTGSFTQSGGTNSLPAGGLSLYVGYGRSGSYTLSGSGYISALSEQVGYATSGSFNQSGGTNTVVQGVLIGTDSGATGTYTLSAGTLIPYYVVAGYSGSGTFLQSGGMNNMMAGSGTLFLGSFAGSSGTYMLSGGSLTALSEIIGQNGTACIFSQSSGFNSASGSVSLGDNSGAEGTYILSGGYLITTNEHIGYTGVGTLAQTGGTNAALGVLYLGRNSGGSGSYNLMGGSLASAVEYIAYTGSGTFTQSGGTNNVSSVLELSVGTAAIGTYNLNGGLLDLSSSGLTHGAGGSATFNFGGGTLGANASWSSSLKLTLTGSGGNAAVDTTGGSITLSGSLSGPGGLIKIGNGTLTLSGTGNYTGGTYIEAGRLVVTNSKALPDGSNLLVGNALAFAPVVPLNALAATGTVSPVPEPGTSVLLATGVFIVSGTWLRRRRRV